ncbi:hypothetical protein R75461_05286 [Paraburkholderia nemoris]|uniref:hypothetical protein n=1 Tax=Paraburkholderia nemoris TaxID=2793076 RepID=UPI0019093222|nr:MULTISPECIES: hypothetical protein [Paraburkholderia]MBK3783945.1 hypothetical protein [Paraburkholderia aspalathi]CAE6803162.1 hypothetical protein R75461_05286 [Paraburkholderia nemoris]
MKNHSLEGLKQKAQRFTCTMVCGTTGAAQSIRGVTVVVESTPITCLYDSPADSFLWIVYGQFVHEDEVRAFLDEGKPPATPKEISVSDELAKFDRYRADLLPVLATHVQTEGREQYETLVRLSEQWGTLYYAPGGYTQLLEAIERTAKLGHGPVPLNVLVGKQDAAEAALLDVAERFMAECKRLDMSSVSA